MCMRVVIVSPEAGGGYSEFILANRSYGWSISVDCSLETSLNVWKMLGGAFVLANMTVVKDGVIPLYQRPENLDLSTATSGRVEEELVRDMPRFQCIMYEWLRG